MTNNAERELLPCPFCGWQFVRIRDTDEGIFAECCDDKCHAHGPWERNEQKAVAAWNKRAQASGVPDEVRLALQYSRNYAKAAPYLNKTCIEHIEGLCDLLERISSEIPKKIIVGEDISPNREAYADGWNACRDAMLSAASTPPKSASVPVERLEGLINELRAMPLSWEEKAMVSHFAELIAEYK